MTGTSGARPARRAGLRGHRPPRRGRAGRAPVSCAAPAQAVCTGTLIAPRIVLTAAHCLEPLPAGRSEFALARAVRSGTDARRAPYGPPHRGYRTFSATSFGVASHPNTNARDRAFVIYSRFNDARWAR
ncbi:trypsin-like serine protease [Pendulispora albinea]|uniref:trypsin-like serine protease n=1 Tax=Pendulispora albinea TaxID=2741071 RepID=UPI00374E00C6